ncbi:MAG: ABC transporter permease [Halobacteriales archaeon]
MSERRYLLRRVAFAVLSVYLVLSAMFLVIAFTPDKNFKAERAVWAWGQQDAPTDEEFAAFRDAYMEARDRSGDPLLVRWGDWLWDVTTFEWGYSPTKRGYVAPIIAGAVSRTAMYVVPGFLLAVLGGTAFGIYSAWNRGDRNERLGRGVIYLVFGLPSFFVAAVGLALLAGDPPRAELLRAHVLPAVVLALSMLAGLVSYTRAHSMEYVNATFITALHAKGLRERAIWWRILRTVAVPITSLLFTELLAVLLLNVYVLEFVFGIEGFGRLTYWAVQNYDISLILGTTYVVVAVGVGGSFLQDVISAVLDPRIEL